ncbi:MAG: CocE/NonD family hydrolase, partial [Promethearchaeota archaeon]
WGASYFGMTQVALASNPKGLLTCLNPSMTSFTNLLWHPYGMYRVGFSGSAYIITSFTTQYKDMPPFDFDGWDDKGFARKLYFNPYFSLYNEPVDSDRLKLSDLAQMSKIKYQMKAINSLFNLNIKINQEDDGSYLELLKAVFYDRRIKHDHKLLPHTFGQDFKINTPMLMVTGIYDVFFEWTMEDLRQIQKNSPELFKTNFKIIIGPWAHIHPLARTSLKSNILYFQYLMQMWWFDYWLRQDGSDLSKIPPVKVYVKNKKIWRNFNKWPPETTETKIYLHSKGNANTRFGDGTLTKLEPKDEPPDKFDFNPSNPVIMRGGPNLFLLAGAQNQIKQEDRNDVLIYSTEKLQQGIEVIGEVKIVFYASSSAKDTDFTIKIVDVYPSGRKALNIVNSGVRARFRNGDMNKPELLEPGKIYKYELYIGTTSILFKKNHRIRIEISSSCFPEFDVNSNLAGEKIGKKYIIAHQTIYHDKEHPSHLILPVFKS